MSSFLHVIADYGQGDPAFAEVIHRLKAADPEIQVQPTAVPAFSTVATGFWIAQLGLHNPSFDGLGIYSNTAPRKHDTGRQEDNSGEELVYAELANGVPVIAVDAGYNLAFIRDSIDSLHELDIPQSGSQFRSRDYFPDAVVSIMQGDQSHVADPIDPARLPEPPDKAVASVDGYGNIKTTIRHASIDIEPGTTFGVELNGVEHELTYRESTFDVRDGQLVMAPGSSGGDDRFIEIFLRGGNAADRFQQPGPGDRLTIQP